MNENVSRDETPSKTGAGSLIYGDPALYEHAFGFRDFDKEIVFLNRLCEKHGAGALKSILELGAGPAWHSVSAVKTHHCVAVAMDNSKAMVRRAEARARENALLDSMAVVEADMSRFDPEALKAVASKLTDPKTKRTLDAVPDAESFGFDLVTVLLGTAAHLTESEDAVSCFALAGACLKPDGILVLELEHPFDLFDGQLLDAQGDAWDREIEDDGDANGLGFGSGTKKVLVEWGREGDVFDVETHILERTVGVNVVDEKGRPVEEYGSGVEETVRCRIFTAPEIALIGKLAGLKVVAIYGDMDEDVPLNHDEAHAMIVVMKRAGTRSDLGLESADE